MHTIINENEFQTKKVSATNFQCTEKKLSHNVLPSSLPDPIRMFTECLKRRSLSRNRLIRKATGMFTGLHICNCNRVCFDSLEIQQSLLL